MSEINGIDDIIGSIDRALWRVQDRAVNNVTPFTYRDGLTFIEVLERIRGAVVDCIDYIGKFGKEQDAIIKKLNDVVSNFITEVEKTHSEWNKTLDAKQKLVLDTIEEFKHKLIESEIEPQKYTGELGELDRGLLKFNFMDKTQARVPTIDLIAKKHAADIAARQALEANVNTLISTRYTKDESDARFAPRNYKTEAIIIGSSNATPQANHWCENVCKSLGYNPNNYAIGGGAFTSDKNSRFDTQLNNAYAGLGARNVNVDAIFIVDMLNDIRANHDVTAQAQNCANIIVNRWPGAKVYIIPVIWNKSSLNTQAAYMGQNISRSIERVKRGMSSVAPAVCDGSQSWFWEGSDVGANHVRGSDEVHLTDASYLLAWEYTVAWMRGDSGWKNYGWTSLENYGNAGWGPKKDSMKNMFVSREGTTISLQGKFDTANNIAANTHFWSVPSWATPVTDVTLLGTTHDASKKFFSINKLSQIFSFESINAGFGVFFGAQYRIW